MIGFDCKKNVFIIYIYFGGEIFSRLGTDKDEVSILRKLEIICPVNNKKLYHHFFFPTMMFLSWEFLFYFINENESFHQSYIGGTSSQKILVKSEIGMPILNRHISVYISKK